MKKIKKLNLSKIEIIKLFNLDKVTRQEIASKYIDFRIVPKCFGPSVKLDERMCVVLEEAKRTLTPNEVYKELHGLFAVDKWQMAAHKQCNDVEVLVLFSNIGNNRKSVTDAMADCGWFLVGEQDVNLNDGNWIILSFDPMFQDDVSDTVMQQGVLYHWAPMYALESIRKNGLEPRTENKRGNHPERVYFFSGKMPLNDLVGFGKDICSENRNNLNDCRYVLLSVETGDLRGVSFHHDPHADLAFWTEERIDPSIIKVVSTYDFNQ